MIVCLPYFDRNPIADHAAYSFSDVHDGMIFESNIKYLSIDDVVRVFKTPEIKIHHVFYMDVGSLLFATKNQDLAIVDGMIGENIHRQVETLARREAADSCGTE